MLNRSCQIKCFEVLHFILQRHLLNTVHHHNPFPGRDVAQHFQPNQFLELVLVDNLEGYASGTGEVLELD